MYFPCIRVAVISEQIRVCNCIRHDYFNASFMEITRTGVVFRLSIRAISFESFGGISSSFIIKFNLYSSMKFLDFVAKAQGLCDPTLSYS